MKLVANRTASRLPLNVVPGARSSHKICALPDEEDYLPLRLIRRPKRRNESPRICPVTFASLLGVSLTSPRTDRRLPCRRRCTSSPPHTSRRAACPRSAHDPRDANL